MPEQTPEQMQFAPRFSLATIRHSAMPDNSNLDLVYSSNQTISTSGSRPVENIDPAWVGLTVVGCLLLATLILCGWLIWRTHSLVRAVRELKTDAGKDVILPSAFGFLPRFKLRTLLILFTVAAVTLGVFAKEFSRARRQGDIVAQLEMSEAFDSYGGAHYRLGLLGNSQLAGLICDWVHPHFGCRLTHLNMEYEDLYRPQQDGLDPADLVALVGLSDLEVLRIAYRDLATADVEAIAQLSKLKKLSLSNCRMPANSTKLLSELHSLVYLDLNKCNLVDTDIPPLTTLTGLTWLSLAENKLTDNAFVEIEKLHQLQVLSVASNRITNAGVAFLLQLGALSDLDLSFTYIDAEGASYLIELPNLQYVNLSNCGAIWSKHKAEVEDALLENKRLEIEWHSRGPHGNGWEFYDNRPSVPYFGSSSGAFGSGSGQFAIPAELPE